MALLGLRNLIQRLTLIVSMGVLGITFAEGALIDEYQVKAAFLFNFAKFVEWPEQAFQNPDQRITICVLGQNPFGTALDEAIEGKIVGRRKFVVLEIANPKPGQCHILFVSASERKRLRAVLSEVKECCVLTVGEADEFIASGGMINLRLRDARVRMEIDRDAAVRAGLRISSKLLSLAEIAAK